jgi:imidazolonepropionase-like amidohydrolase
MTLKSGVGMIVNWPNAGSDNYEENLLTLRDLFADARAYHKVRKAVESGQATGHDTDTRWEAMIPVFDGEMPLVVNANEVRQIQDAITWADEEGLSIILLGGRDAHLVADHLREKEIPVIISSVIGSPNRDWESYDASYSLPNLLYQAGIEFAIAGIANPANANRLPYEAGAAAAYGLPVHEAIKALTTNPAKILGLDDRLGSLEVGKDASLLITDGNPIEYATQVEQVYIQGRKSDMMDMHRQFYYKYREKVDQARR